MTTMKRSVSRWLLLAGACALCGAAVVSPAMARPDFGVRGGAYAEETGAFVGAEALFGVDDGKHWFGNPNVEHAFVDDGDLTTASFDFHYDFESAKPYTIWAGGGPTLIFKDGQAFEDQDDRDAGVNLLAGVGAKKGEVRPYGQIKVIVANDTQAVVGAGIRF